MKIFTKIPELRKELSEIKKSGKTIGFVPTMGALHAGHISLIEQSKQKSDITVVSIFVNPTQFNNSADFEKYPITIEQDIAKLELADCDILFNPQKEEIYPEEDTRKFDFGILETTMEGEHRPGHFNGVALVVSKLFEIVEPDFSFFGEKDFQQLAVVKELVKQEKYPIKIIGCPIIREKDGLAMSSRNVRLSENERIDSANISRALKNSVKYLDKYSIKETIAKVISEIEEYKSMKVEYFEIFNSKTFKPEKNKSKYSHACITVNVGNVRLIDNISFVK